MCGRAVSKLVLSNTAWFICGGFLIWLEYLMVGFVMCVTLVLMKPGYTILKLSWLVAAPLGADWGRIVEAAVRLNFRRLKSSSPHISSIGCCFPCCRTKQPVGAFPNPGVSTGRMILWIPFALMIGATHLAFMLLLVRQHPITHVCKFPFRRVAAGLETLRRAWFLLCSISTI